jgi:hypothetical protein
MKKTKEFNFLKRFLTILITFTILTATNNVLAWGEVILSKHLINPEDILIEEVEISPSIPAYPLPLRM